MKVLYTTPMPEIQGSTDESQACAFIITHEKDSLSFIYPNLPKDTHSLTNSALRGENDLKQIAETLGIETSDLMQRLKQGETIKY
jgi:hypothetical protein